MSLRKMLRILEKRDRRRLVIGCALVAAALASTVFREAGVLDSLRISRMRAQIESDGRRLSEENSLMKREVEDLKTNRSRIEMEARKLGFVYPGEFALYWKRDDGTTARVFIRPPNSGKHAPGANIEVTKKPDRYLWWGIAPGQQRRDASASARWNVE